MRSRGAVGYTLIEMLVVLAILALAATLALPALLRARASDSPLEALMAAAQGAAAARGEIVEVEIEPSGAWHMRGSGSVLERDRLDGRIPSIASVPLTLRVTPDGSCAFDVRSASPGAAALAVEPLTCVIRAVRPATSS